MSSPPTDAAVPTHPASCRQKRLSTSTPRSTLALLAVSVLLPLILFGLAAAQNRHDAVRAAEHRVLNGRAPADAALLLRPNIPVLYTTGYSADATVQDGQSIAPTGKPFRAEALVASIGAMLVERVETSPAHGSIAAE